VLLVLPTLLDAGPTPSPTPSAQSPVREQTASKGPTAPAKLSFRPSALATAGEAMAPTDARARPREVPPREE
jgi:hypothetical protein